MILIGRLRDYRQWDDNGTTMENQWDDNGKSIEDIRKRTFFINLILKNKIYFIFYILKNNGNK